MEKEEKLAISMIVRKMLWAKSGNRCAFCKKELIAELDLTNESFNIGEECHIISSKLNGPRHKVNLDDYDTFDNLLLLCRNHHKEIDTLTDTYSEEILRAIKQQHENWVRETLNIESTSSDEDIRFLNRIVSGKELMDILFNSHGYRFDYDELVDESDIEYIASTLQILTDYADISSELEIYDRVKLNLEFHKILKELEGKDYFLFGEKREEEYMGLKDFPVSTLLIKKQDSEDIIKVKMEGDNK